ncbi:MAG: glycosyltransferase family 4 protein, partial [Candidatus Hinthialibacter sp.]
NRSGTGRYAWGLIQGWLHQSSVRHVFSIVIPSEFQIPTEWRNHDNARFYSAGACGAQARMAWEQRRLPDWLRQIKPDIFHSPAFIAPVFRKIDCAQAVAVHDLAFLRHPETIPALRRFYYRVMIPRSWRAADAVITDSEAVAGELAARPDAPKKIATVHLGVDRRRFSPEAGPADASVLRDYGLASPYLLFVGTREPRKNLAVLVQAFRQARQLGWQAQLAIAGRYGWMESRSNDGSGIHWLDHIPEGRLPALYRGACACAAPSFYEGFDLPPVEALACGTPVLASDIPVHREILGDHAVYLPVNDASAWSQAMLKITEKKPLIIPHEIRDWGTVAEDTIKVFEAVLHHKESPAAQ